MTEPGRLIRPRSLRSRSTIIAFSARSFAEARSRSAAARSSAGHRAARRGALHRPGHDRAVAELEEQLGRGGEHAVAAEVEVRRVRAALRVAEVAVEASRVALHAGAQAHRVVDLVRLAGGDQLVDPPTAASYRSRGVVGAHVPSRRPPGPPSSRGSGRVVSSARSNIANHAERQRGERVLGVTGADHEGGVEAGRGLVAHEPGDPQTALRPPPRPPRARPTTSSARVASSTPTGSTSRNDGEAPVRSSNRASSMPATIRSARSHRVAPASPEPVADSLIACPPCWSRCPAASIPRSPPACCTSRATTCWARTCASCISTASITGAAARAPGATRPRPRGSPGSRSRSAT